MRHRTSLVTAALVVIIVMAGSTAAAANLGAFDGTGGSTSSPADSAIATDSTEPVPVSQGTELAPVAEQPELIAYEIPNTALVVVQRSGSLLSLAQAQAPGWQVDVLTEGPELTVSLTNGSRRIDFGASVVGGDVSARVDESSDSSQGL